MIVLENIYLEYSGDEVFLKADCIIDNKSETLWYSTSRDNEKFISLTNADCFILFIFIYAVFYQKRFIAKVPVSKQLKYGLLEVMLPSLREMGLNSEQKDFIFHKEDDSLFPEAKATGTAMSFGVDSLFTFINSEKSAKPVDVLTLFNAGAFGQEGGEKARMLFNRMKTRVKSFSKTMQKDFVWVDTNLNEIFKMPFVQTHTYRNFSCALLLQKLFQNYLYASGITIKDFKLNLLDSTYYDLLISKAIQSNKMQLYISGLNTNRFHKTQIISDYTITQNILSVCLITSDNTDVQTVEKNCSKCFKCVRTMLTLEVLGKLEKFKDVFDLEIFRKNKDKYIADLLYRKIHMKDILAEEIFAEMKATKYYYSKRVYVELVKLILKKTLKKLKRV